MFIFILFISPTNAVRQKIYSKASPSDEGIYIYFSEILKDVENCLDMFLEENDALNLSTSIEYKIKLIDEENRFYHAKGIEGNVSIVIKPFLQLADGIKKLSQSQSVFLKSIEQSGKNYSAYLNASIAVMNMKLAVNEIKDSINEIELIELKNETSKLHFDVSEIKLKLRDIYNLILYYESLLTRYDREEVILTVSNTHPFLYQEITIYIHAKNVKLTSMFIDNIKYDINGINVLKKYSFKELGRHVIYAGDIICLSIHSPL